MILSLLIVLTMGLGLVLLLWGASTAFPVVNRVVTRSFWCRFRWEDVTAEFQEDAWNGRRVDVNRCSAFEPSSAITCDKVCLRLQHLEAAPGVDAQAEAAAEETPILPRSTADADRVAEELLIELQRR